MGRNFDFPLKLVLKIKIYLIMPHRLQLSDVFVDGPRCYKQRSWSGAPGLSCFRVGLCFAFRVFVFWSVCPGIRPSLAVRLWVGVLLGRTP